MKAKNTPMNNNAKENIILVYLKQKLLLNDNAKETYETPVIEAKVTSTTK